MSLEHWRDLAYHIWAKFETAENSQSAYKERISQLEEKLAEQLWTVWGSTAAMVLVVLISSSFLIAKRFQAKWRIHKRNSYETCVDVLNGSHIDREFRGTRVHVQTAIEKVTSTSRSLIEKHPVIFIGFHGNGKSSTVSALHKYWREESGLPLLETDKRPLVGEFVKNLTVGVEEWTSQISIEVGNGAVEGQAILFDTAGFEPGKDTKVISECKQALWKLPGMTEDVLRNRLMFVLVASCNGQSFRNLGSFQMKNQFQQILREFLQTVGRSIHLSEKNYPVILPVLTHKDLKEGKPEELVVAIKTCKQFLEDHLKAAGVYDRFELKDPLAVCSLEDLPAGCSQSGIPELATQLKCIFSRQLQSKQLQHVVAEMMAQPLICYVKEWHRKHPTEETEGMLSRRAAYAIARTFDCELENFPTAPSWRDLETLLSQSKRGQIFVCNSDVGDSVFSTYQDPLRELTRNRPKKEEEEVSEAFLGGEAAEEDRRQKFCKEIQDIEKHLFYHYCSPANAFGILQKGFWPSSKGMGGKGVYFSSRSPVDKNFSNPWPNPKWFQEVRELNHEQEAKDRNRKDAVYAVVVVSLSKSSPYLQEVDGRTDAYVFKPQELERHCLWANIVKAYKLQGSRVRDLVDTPEVS